jgi:thiamine monophosphate synthase
LRIVALGGISSETANACLAAGADALAAIGAVLRPEESLVELVRALGVAR